MNIPTPPSDLYDDYYYRNTCGGHRDFNFSKGEVLPPWMMYALKLANLQPCERVLDLGTGRGEIAYQSAKRGCFSIGLDYSLTAIKFAKLLHGKAKKLDKPFELILSDARFLPFPHKQFDVIFMLDIVEHLSQNDLLIVLQQAHDCLAPNGRLIIHTMPNKNYYRWGYPIYRALMRIFGGKLPKDPKDRFYHGECHVNIQTPKSLQNNLIDVGFSNIRMKLTQLSGSKSKRLLCKSFPLRYILANDIIAIGINNE
mgnify:CR=1 FL=1